MLSVVIPVYNGEKYIRQCIRSVLRQGDIVKEILVINDGSADGTVEIVQAIAQKEKKITLYTKENGGVSSARNFAMDYVTGKYVWFFDADDIMCRGAAESLVARMEEHGAQIGIGNCVYYFDSNRTTKKTEIWMEDGVWTDRRVEILHFYEIPSNKILSTAFLRENELLFPKLKIGEDTCFFSKCVSKSACIVTQEQCICLYRVTEQSCSRRYDLTVLGKLEAFAEIRRFFAENEMGKEWMEALTFNQLYHYRDVLKTLPFYRDKEERRIVLREFSAAISELHPEAYREDEKYRAIVKQIGFYLKIKDFWSLQSVSFLIDAARKAKRMMRKSMKRS